MTEHRIPIGRSVPSEYEIPLAPFDVTFTPIDVGPGVRPTPLDGSSGLTDRQAVASVVASALGDPAPGVQVAARYGIYSSPYPAKRLPSGQLQPLYQNRPVWLVTYFGPGLNIRTHRADRSGPSALKHQVNALVDASSGLVLSVFG